MHEIRNTKHLTATFIFAKYINSKKTLCIVSNDAHYYKIIEILKQYKNYNTFSDTFGHAGTIIREQSCT